MTQNTVSMKHIKAYCTLQNGKNEFAKKTVSVFCIPLKHSQFSVSLGLNLNFEIHH